MPIEQTTNSTAVYQADILPYNYTSLVRFLPNTRQRASEPRINQIHFVPQDEISHNSLKHLIGKDRVA